MGFAWCWGAKLICCGDGAASRDSDNQNEVRNDLKIERVGYSLMGTGREIGSMAEGGAGNVRGAAVGSAGGARMQAPLAEREAVEHVIHGDRRVDHYAWMKNRKDLRVKAYLEAENAYADAADERNRRVPGKAVPGDARKDSADGSERAV